MAIDSETRKAAARTLATYAMRCFVFASISDLLSRVRVASLRLGEKTIRHSELAGSVFESMSCSGEVRCDGLNSGELLRSLRPN